MIYFITHKDMDGAACAVVAHMRFKRDKLQIISADYNDIDDILEMYLPLLERSNQIWLADISPSQAFFDRVRSGELKLPPTKFVIIDHHANGTLAIPENRELVNRTYFDTSMCGALLFYTDLVDVEDDLKAPLEEFLAIVDSWDRWLLDSPHRSHAEYMQRAFTFFGFNDFVSKRLHDPVKTLHRFTTLEEGVVYRLGSKEEKYIEGRMKAAQEGTDSDGRTFYWVHAGHATSNVGNALAELEGAEYGAVVNVEYNKIELRSVPGGADVGAIAKSRGGGGHLHASGYPLSKDSPFPG